MTDTFTSSPFVTAIEPITETDDEIRAFLADAEIPPLLPAIAYATGDVSLLRPELAPDPIMAAMPQGGLSDEQQAQARELALEALIRFRDGGCRVVPPPADEQLLTIMQYTVGGAEMREYLPLLEEGARVPRRGPARARLAQGRHRARRRLPRRDHRCRHVRPPRRTSVAAGGCPVRDPGEERRRRRHVAGEHVSRVSGRQPESQLQLRVPRSGTTGRCTSRPRTCCSTTCNGAPTSSGCASTCGSRRK